MYICFCYQRFIIVTIYTMKIANQNTFQQFDKLREQIFAHKQQQRKQHKEVKNPFSNKFRFVLPMALVIGGGWMIYHNLPDMKDYLIQNKILSYQQYIVIDSLKTFAKCKLSQSFSFSDNKSNPNLANDIYLTKLQSDYLYLKEKMPQKILQVRTKTNFSFWIFNWGVSETMHLINEHGDLITRTKNYKFNLGGTANIWGNTDQIIIKRDKIFGYYINASQKMQENKNCQNINIFTKIHSKNEEYENTLKTCMQNEARIRGKIQNFMNERIKKQTKRKMKDRSKSPIKQQ